MNKLLLLFSILLFANIIFAQGNYKHENSFYKNGIIADNPFATNSLKDKNTRTISGLANYYVITTLDTSDQNFAYLTPIDIYRDSLLVERINNISDFMGPARFKHDNIYRGPFPSLIEYSYNPDRTLSEVKSYSFSDAGEKYLSEKDVYFYKNNKLDSIAIFQAADAASNLEEFEKTVYQYGQDSVISITSIVISGNNFYDIKSIELYKDGLITAEESFNYNSSLQQWNKYSSTDYFYDSYNNVQKIVYNRIDPSGNSTTKGQTENIYNADHTLNKSIYTGSYYFVKSYAYGENNVVAILFPKDEQVYTWSDNQINFHFYSYNSGNINFSFSTDDGSSWQTIAENISPSDMYSWTIPHTSQENYLFKIEDAANSNIRDIASVIIHEKKVITKADHNTGSLQFQVMNNGAFGGISSYPGFSFNNQPNVLYSGGFAVSSSSVPFKGAFSFTPINYDFTNSENMYELSSTSDFDQISDCAFVENNEEIGISVTQETLSNSGDDFILIKYKIKNTTSNTIDSLVAGIFMDIDIPDAANNLGGADDVRDFVYQYSLNGPDHYGIAAMQNVCGADVTDYYDSGNLRKSFRDNLKTIGPKVLTVPNDYRSFISSGPYTLTAGSEIEVGFAIIAGKDSIAFSNNVESAKQKYNSLVSDISENISQPNSFSLYQNYPNPFNPATTIKYSVPRLSSVRLSVYNAIGQLIKTLVNEEKSPGNYSVTFNGAGLPSGVYFYHIKAGEYSATKKLILLK